MALIHIAGNKYELIFENRNGWNVEAFRNRYSEVLERYDYIVGDWGYNQLRLKGFFRDGHTKATKDSTFSYMTDYINEYCNFGCAYFILEKKQASETLEVSDDDIYIEELEYTRPVPVPRESKDKDKEKTASLSSVDEAGTAKEQSSQRNQSKRGNRDKQGQDSSADDGTSSSHKPDKPRRQRQGAKQHHQDKAEASQEPKQEQKKDGKPKRKDFYRKGPRPFDKKNKGNQKGNNDKAPSPTE